MRVDWFSGVCGDGGDGEAHCFFFFLACVLTLPWRSRCRLFRVRLYHMLCPGFAFRAFLASTAHLSCGMIGGRQEKTDTKK